MQLKDLETFRNVLFCGNWNFIHFTKVRDSEEELCEISLDKALELLSTFFNTKQEEAKGTKVKKGKKANPIQALVE